MPRDPTRGRASGATAPLCIIFVPFAPPSEFWKNYFLLLKGTIPYTIVKHAIKTQILACSALYDTNTCGAVANMLENAPPPTRLFPSCVPGYAPSIVAITGISRGQKNSLFLPSGFWVSAELLEISEMIRPASLNINSVLLLIHIFLYKLHYNLK